MERVSIIEGKKPVIFIAPHGANCDDLNTALIAEILAENCNGYAVINRGWERAEKIDYKRDKANCNNAYHCHEDVIKEEFLDPILRYKNRILKKWSRACVIYIHGMSDEIQDITGINDLHYVIGWGRGKPPSYTCQAWVKNFLAWSLSTTDNCTVAEGRAEGKYAAWSRKNMSQLFRKWYPDSEVDTLQIEIVRKIRNSPIVAETTAQILSIAIEEMLDETALWEQPSDFHIIKV